MSRFVVGRARKRAPRNHEASQQGSAESEFWNCEPKLHEWFLLVTAFLIAAAAHLSPVLNSGLGKLLTYLLPAVSYLSPFTGFFFLGCCQFIPFPDGSAHNPAQAGVLVWLPIVLMRYRGLHLSKITRLWPVLPFLSWHMMMTGELDFMPTSEWGKSLIYSMIACQLATDSKGQYLKCLLGLSLGALLVMTAYWATQVGLPVQVSDWGGNREGFERVGSVRADAVMVWPALLFAISGLLGIQISFASKSSPYPSPLWLTYMTITLFVASLPPLVSTMSHGAFAGFGMTILALSWAAWVAGKGGAFGNPRFQLLLRWGGVGLLAIVLLFVFDAFQLRTKVVSLDKYYKGTAAESGAAASRTGVWHDSINTILKYPLFGIAVTGDQEEITSEYASQGWYLSHNIFLDFGRSLGIPGMLMIAFFFFWPGYRMFQSGDRARYLPFLMTHFSMLIFWLSLSFTFYKTFWALWMLMAIVAPVPRVFANKRRRTAPAVRSGVHRPLTS